jgi:hypothetical protein
LGKVWIGLDRNGLDWIGWRNSLGLDRLISSVVDLGCGGSRFLVVEVVVEGLEVASVVAEGSEVAAMAVVAVRRTGRRGRRLEGRSS